MAAPQTGRRGFSTTRARSSTFNGNADGGHGAVLGVRAIIYSWQETGPTAAKSWLLERVTLAERGGFIYFFSFPILLPFPPYRTKGMLSACHPKLSFATARLESGSFCSVQHWEVKDGRRNGRVFERTTAQ